MLEIIGILFILFIIYLGYTNVSKKVKIELKKIEACINDIEQNPDYLTLYDEFVKVWNSSLCIQQKDILKSGLYNRILQLCAKNSSNIKVWELLEKVIKKLNINIFITIRKNINQANTIRILADALFIEFKNELIKQKIISIIHLLQWIKQIETQYLYQTALKILENNSSSQEAKILVLDIGRLHYSILRPDKRPTIYDEQAIQNDILVRYKQ